MKIQLILCGDGDLVPPDTGEGDRLLGEDLFVGDFFRTVFLILISSSACEMVLNMMSLSSHIPGPVNP